MGGGGPTLGGGAGLVARGPGAYIYICIYICKGAVKAHFKGRNQATRCVAEAGACAPNPSGILQGDPRRVADFGL